jgi:ABC-type molybdenum transport system ATPase subunit/photorepair protein PhrA
VALRAFNTPSNQRIELMSKLLVGELLLGLDIPEDQHYGLMSEIAPGWKLRVLLAQALFSDPEILLLDEPTNNLMPHNNGINHTKIFKSKLILTQNPQSLTITNANRTARWG